MGSRFPGGNPVAADELRRIIHEEFQRTVHKELVPLARGLAKMERAVASMDGRLGDVERAVASMDGRLGGVERAVLFMGSKLLAPDEYREMESAMVIPKRHVV